MTEIISCQADFTKLRQQIWQKFLGYSSRYVMLA